MFTKEVAHPAPADIQGDWKLSRWQAFTMGYGGASHSISSGCKVLNMAIPLLGRTG
jgi:hypothetical protein